MNLKREELAWAAGFFDGEGYIGARIGGEGTNRMRSRKISIVISQKTPGLLERFKKSVGGFGHFRFNESGNFWSYDLNRIEHVQFVVAALWAFLGRIKREQAKKALVIYDIRTAPTGKAGGKIGRNCEKNGHVFDPSKVRTIENGTGKRCTQCEYVAKKRWMKHTKELSNVRLVEVKP